MKRPSDKNIRIGKVLFGLIVFTSAAMSFLINDVQIQDSLFGYILSDVQQTAVKHTLMALGLIPLLSGAFDINLLERKYTRVLQVVYAIVLFWYSGIILEGAKIGIEVLYFFLAFIPLVGGITGKFITKKGLKAQQKITKIRV